MTPYQPNVVLNIVDFQMTPLAVDITKNGPSMSVRAMFTPGTGWSRRMDMRKPVRVQRHKDGDRDEDRLPEDCVELGELRESWACAGRRGNCRCR